MERTADDVAATRGAFLGSALFAALIVAFSSLGAGRPTAAMLLAIGVLGAASHLALLPVVPVLAAPTWARAGGYAWIAIDVMLNVATINGAQPAEIAALRLGGHVPAAIWIGMSAALATGAVRLVGLALSALLIFHAFASPWLPPWVLFIPFVLIPVWLALVGGALRQRAA